MPDDRGLAGLIERVEKCTGPDVILDHDIARYLDGYRHATWQPPLTASLEAVVALIERELPGRTWDIRASQVPQLYIGHAGQYVASAPTPALALLLAFLKAKATLSGAENA